MKKLLILLLLIPFISNGQWTKEEFYKGTNGVTSKGSIYDSLSTYYGCGVTGIPYYYEGGLIVLPNQDPNLFKDSIVSQVDKQIQIFVDLVNEVRVENGLNSLTYNYEMQRKLSEVHNRYQVTKDKIHHPKKVNVNYSYGEIADGGYWLFFNPNVANMSFISFKNSPSHWDEIMYENHTEISVSIIYVDETEFTGTFRNNLSGSYYLICNFK